MKKFWLTIPLALIIFVGLFFFQNQKSIPQNTSIPQLATGTTTPSPTDFIARFEIYTLGTKRVFTSSMYHNLSDDVFISATNPSQVHVKKAGTTWADFFATLPMKLTKNCLTTGTKQTFCTNNSQKLKFFINDLEDPNALDKEIQKGDFLKVIYD